MIRWADSRLSWWYGVEFVSSTCGYRSSVAESGGEGGGVDADSFLDLWRIHLSLPTWSTTDRGAWDSFNVSGGEAGDRIDMDDGSDSLGNALSADRPRRVEGISVAKSVERVCEASDRAEAGRLNCVVKGPLEEGTKRDEERNDDQDANSSLLARMSLFICPNLLAPPPHTASPRIHERIRNMPQKKEKKSGSILHTELSP